MSLLYLLELRSDLVFDSDSEMCGRPGFSGNSQPLICGCPGFSGNSQPLIFSVFLDVLETPEIAAISFANVKIRTVNCAIQQ